MLSEADKKKMANAIQSNQHEIYIADVGQMDMIVRSNHNGHVLSQENYDLWKKISGSLEFGANYGSTVDTAALTVKLIGEIGGGGFPGYNKVLSR